VCDWRWRSRLEVGFRNPKALAVVAMQLHLGVERLVEEAGKYSNRLEVGRFGGGKCEDAAVFGEEHVVLSEIEAEAIDRERPVAEAAHERMLQLTVPNRLRLGPNRVRE
jgi:hypothetical protein